MSSCLSQALKESTSVTEDKGTGKDEQKDEQRRLHRSTNGTRLNHQNEMRLKFMKNSNLQKIIIHENSISIYIFIHPLNVLHFKSSNINFRDSNLKFE